MSDVRGKWVTFSQNYFFLEHRKDLKKIVPQWILDAYAHTYYRNNLTFSAKEFFEIALPTLMRWAQHSWFGWNCCPARLGGQQGSFKVDHHTIRTVAVQLRFNEFIGKFLINTFYRLRLIKPIKDWCFRN